jgi:8-oxo-dGTP diphosphatase
VANDPRVKVGACALIERPNPDTPHQQQILMVLRAPDASHGENTWALPGGWIDYGEEPWRTVVREVDEETGVQVHSGDDLPFVTAHSYEEQEWHVITVTYRVRSWSGDAWRREPHKHLDVRWVPVSQLRHLDLFTSTYYLLAQLGFVV